MLIAAYIRSDTLESIYGLDLVQNMGFSLESPKHLYYSSKKANPSKSQETPSLVASLESSGVIATLISHPSSNNITQSPRHSNSPRSLSTSALPKI